MHMPCQHIDVGSALPVSPAQGVHDSVKTLGKLRRMIAVSMNEKVHRIHPRCGVNASTDAQARMDRMIGFPPPRQRRMKRLVIRSLSAWRWHAACC